MYDKKLAPNRYRPSEYHHYAGENLPNEVVVVGYGTQIRSTPGAVQSVSGEKLEGRPIVNLADGLEA